MPQALHSIPRLSRKDSLHEHAFRQIVQHKRDRVRRWNAGHRVPLGRHLPIFRRSRLRVPKPYVGSVPRQVLPFVRQGALPLLADRLIDNDENPRRTRHPKHRISVSGKSRGLDPAPSRQLVYKAARIYFVHRVGDRFVLFVFAFHTVLQSAPASMPIRLSKCLVCARCIVSERLPVKRVKGSKKIRV